MFNNFLVRNKTFYDRKCGQTGGINDTCEVEEDRYPGMNLKCKSCHLDWCNGAEVLQKVSSFVIVAFVAYILILLSELI
jgi:hypothetical protein